MLSVRAMDAVWRHSAARGVDLLVMLALADNADDNGVAWPSRATISAKARVAQSTVQESVTRLAAAGELAVETRSVRLHHDDGRRQMRRPPNLYRLQLPGLSSDRQPVSAPSEHRPAPGGGAATGLAGQEPSGNRQDDDDEGSATKNPDEPLPVVAPTDPLARPISALRALGFKLGDSQQLVETYGARTISEQIDNLKRQGNIRNKRGWLVTALRDGYSAEAEHEPTGEHFVIPAPPSAEDAERKARVLFPERFRDDDAS